MVGCRAIWLDFDAINIKIGIYSFVAEIIDLCQHLYKICILFTNSKIEEVIERYLPKTFFINSQIDSQDDRMRKNAQMMFIQKLDWMKTEKTRQNYRRLCFHSVERPVVSECLPSYFCPRHLTLRARVLYISDPAFFRYNSKRNLLLWHHLSLSRSCKHQAPLTILIFI